MIQRRLEELGHGCFVIEIDALAGSGALSWTPGESAIPVRGGGSIDAGNLDVVWWRRTQLLQRLATALPDRAQTELVSNDCRAALTGALTANFDGVWVNNPAYALLAENKLLQLQIAQAAGFPIPDTLVSQDPARIRAFCSGRDTIVKAVMGTPRAGLLTRMVTAQDLDDDFGLRISPAIYQECVPGTRHLRVQCFGRTMIAVQVTTEHLDWRAHLDSDFRVWPMPDELVARLGSVLDRLGLLMGIVDLKITDEGEIFWLEINQQGQFLFLEGLADVKLTDAFSTFLLEKAGVDV